jgi:hypothetical protein
LDLETEGVTLAPLLLEVTILIFVVEVTQLLHPNSQALEKG